MDKNKIIGLIVIVGLGYLVWTMIGDDSADACAALDQTACGTTDGCAWSDAVADDPATTDADETAAAACSAE